MQIRCTFAQQERQPHKTETSFPQLLLLRIIFSSLYHTRPPVWVKGNEIELTTTVARTYRTCWEVGWWELNEFRGSSWMTPPAEGHPYEKGAHTRPGRA